MHAILTAAYTAEIQAHRAIARTEARSEARWAAVDAHEAAEQHLGLCKAQARKALGTVTARILIRSAREQAEAICG